MFKFASQLADSGEILLGYWGQSNAEPRGARDSEGFQSNAALYLASGIVGNLGASYFVTAVSATSANINGTFVTDALVGQQIRIMWTVYTVDNVTMRPGYGTITANNTTGVCTVDWVIDPTTDFPPNTVTTTFTLASPGLVTAGVTHKLQVGDKVLFVDGGGGSLPPELAFDTYYWVSEVVSNTTYRLATTFDNAIAGTHINFTGAGGGTVWAFPACGSIVWFDDARGMTYPNVRVLQEWLPESAGAYPTTAVDVPGVTFGSDITWETCGLFLDFTWNEGIDGYGVVNSGANVTYGASTLTDASQSWDTNVLYGAKVQVGGQMMTVASNTATQLTFTAAWTSQPADQTEYELHVPHYRDNPNSWTYGYGFRRPSNYTSPIPINSTGYLYNRARGQLSPAYVPVTGSQETRSQNHKFGMILPMAWNVATKIGRRVNIVPQTAHSGGLIRGVNGYTRMGPPTIGWSSFNVLRDFTPTADSGLAARWQLSWETIAPAALLAQGHLDKGVCIGVVGHQGETESQYDSTAALYEQALQDFYEWIRGIIFKTGQTNFTRANDIPCVHGQLGDVWSGTGAATEDTEGVTNSAIASWANRLPSSGYFPVQSTYIADNTHFDGDAEAYNGEQAAAALVALLDTAVQVSVDPDAVEICNLALTHVGEAPKITSLDPGVDASTEAEVCAQLYPVARDAVLEKHTWSFATKFVELVELTKDSTRTAWDYAYRIPDDMASVISVLPQGVYDDYTLPWQPVADYQIPLPEHQVGVNVPAPFAIERDSNGDLVLYTDVENACLRYTARVNASVRQPRLFKVAVSWYLASLLCGPIVKGDSAARLRQQAMQMATYAMNEAVREDGHNRDSKPPHNVPWISGR